LPLEERGQGEDALLVRRASWRERQAVGAGAGAHRREVRVGDAELAEEERPATDLERLVPHRVEALQVLCHGGLLAQHALADLGQARLEVHAEGAAQLAEALVHLGAEAARPRPQLRIPWPERLLRK